MYIRRYTRESRQRQILGAIKGSLRTHLRFKHGGLREPMPETCELCYRMVNAREYFADIEHIG